MSTITSDFVIIGAGIVGVTLALEIRKRYSDASIAIIEKEKEPGLHSSGRNSGVLHAGFYYTADSLKAQFCRDGNRLMKAYCEEKGLHLNKTGKLVVTKNEADLTGLETLYQRGKKNGVDIHLIDEDQARDIEPRVCTYQKAIYTPETASIDPLEVLNSFINDAKKQNITFYYDECFSKNAGKNKLKTKRHQFHCRYVINAAGLYADNIAKQYRFSLHHDIIPFKGLYLYSDENQGSLKTQIYPVPDLNYPFLGVHFTVNAYGKIKIGPTAIPALWRENYSGLTGFSLKEMLSIFKKEVMLFKNNDNQFRQVAIEEMKKYNRRYLVNQATYMLDHVNVASFKTWGKPGIRAQLIDKRTNQLMTDFYYEGDEHSFHVLNAVSPAFTCSLPFSAFLADKIDEKMT